MFLAVIWFPVTVNVSLTKVPGLKTVMVLGEQLHLNSLGGRGMKRETQKHVVSSLTIWPYLLELQLFPCKVPKPCDRESSIPAVEGHDQPLSLPTKLWLCSGKADQCGRKGHLGSWNNFTWGATQGKVTLWSQGSGFELECCNHSSQMLARAQLKKETQQQDARGSTGLIAYILKPSVKNEEIRLNWWPLSTRWAEESPAELQSPGWDILAGGGPSSGGIRQWTSAKQHACRLGWHVSIGFCPLDLGSFFPRTCV